MEPLAVSVACVSLIGIITRASVVVAGFVRDVRGARSDLDGVSRELLSLKTVLELLADDAATATNGSLPDTLRRQIAGIVTNCTGVVVEIEEALKKYEGTRLAKAARWAAMGQEHVAKLRSSLEAHKSALEIALDMVALTMTRNIKADTQEICNNTAAIKQDTAQILAEIVRLQEQLPQDANQQNTSGFMLERYLDNLTSYAESVCDTFPTDVDAAGANEGELNVGIEQDTIQQEAVSLIPDQGSNDAEVEHKSDTDSLQSISPSVPEVISTITHSSYCQHETNTSPPETENSLLREKAQKNPTRQEYTNQPSLELQVRLQNLVLSNGLEVQQQDSSAGSINDQGSINKEVGFLNEHLVLDCPVPERILEKVPHAAPPERDESNHVRYTALTCDPSEFSDLQYILRPSLFQHPRSTEIFIAISISSERLVTNVNNAFALTLKSVIKTVEYLQIMKQSSPWGKDSWKKVVVGIIEDDLVNKKDLSMLEEMGIYSEFDRKSSVSGKAVRAHLYEYSSQFTLHISKLDVEIKTGFTPVQVILCLQEKSHAFRSDDWIKSFGDFLEPRLCIAIEPGTKISGGTIYKMWDAAGATRNPNGTIITPYKGDGLRSLGRTLKQNLLGRILPSTASSN